MGISARELKLGISLENIKFYDDGIFRLQPCLKNGCFHVISGEKQKFYMIFDIQ